MKTMKRLALRAALAAALLPTMLPQPAQAEEAKKQYLYVLRVAPHLQDEAKWSDADKAATGRHFKRLQDDLAKGRVILAGRTSEPLDKTFGLVVFEAADDAAAKAYMDADPAVQAGVMTATLHPYAVALLRK
jgi:uncharacterized protein YciI